MTATMMHEPFYNSGIHFLPELGICAGWVAQENSFASNQVFFNEQRDIALLFSGECFFDSGTKSALKASGHSFSGHGGDCLPHLYEEHGESFFEKLNGLFSGLLIDRRRQGKVFLFNDRYGVERIYWHEMDGALYFASEAKALLRVLPELREFDPEGLAQFLKFGCTLESKTLFRGIQLLPGASVWTFENGRCRKGSYFSAATWESQSELTAEQFESEFQETFARILPRYFESESKIGLSLTAGLDTRMIMACRPQTPQVCYTFDAAPPTTLDSRLAARVAAACGLSHETLGIGPDFFSNFAGNADKTVYVTDGCFGITGTHEIYLNRLGRRLSPVRLTGNYGSEVLRSISTFKPIHLSSELLCPGPNIHSQIEPSPSRHPVTFAAFEEIPCNLFGSLAAGRSQVCFRTPYLDNEIVSLAYRAPGTLRTSSMPALRLIRKSNPALARIPTDRGYVGERSGPGIALKRLFSEVTFKLDYYNNEGLPHWLSPFEPVFKRVNSALGIVGLHKYLHYRSWFRNELANYIRATMNQVKTSGISIWNRKFIDGIAEEHICGRKNYVLEINTVLTLEAVQQLLFRDLPTGTERNGPDLMSRVCRSCAPPSAVSTV